ncbi:MAG: hypothetical protein C4305_05340 [Thermoleophilia bacterium]
MSYRTCPDWPELMEIAPDLQFKHYTAREVALPADALLNLELDTLSLDEVWICCDLDHHVYFARHTAPEVVSALRASHWFDLTEWTTTGPGAAAL